MRDPLADALAALWATNRGRVLARATAVLRELEAAASGRAADLELAAREAHVLAGALGTYGQAGSAVFAEVEGALTSSGSAAPEEVALGALADRVRQIVAAL